MSFKKCFGTLVDAHLIRLPLGNVNVLYVVRAISACSACTKLRIINHSPDVSLLISKYPNQKNETDYKLLIASPGLLRRESTPDNFSQLLGGLNQISQRLFAFTTEAERTLLNRPKYIDRWGQ